MSKNLSLKLKDNIFAETENVIEKLKKSRNAYINEALDFYNKVTKRKFLKDKLAKESSIVSSSSMESLKELELMEDEFFDPDFELGGDE